MEATPQTVPHSVVYVLRSPIPNQLKTPFATQNEDYT